MDSPSNSNQSSYHDGEASNGKNGEIRYGSYVSPPIFSQFSSRIVNPIPPQHPFAPPPLQPPPQLTPVQANPQQQHFVPPPVHQLPHPYVVDPNYPQPTPWHPHQNPKLDFPKFDGMDPRGWVIQCEQYFDFKGWDMGMLRMNSINFHD